MSETATAASTWTPDWKGLHHAAGTFMYGYSFSNDDDYLAEKYGAVIAEYQRQAAAAGLVMVRLDDLTSLRALADDRHDDNPIIQRIDAILAATPEPAPGGDEDTSSPDDEVDAIREPWGPAPWQ